MKVTHNKTGRNYYVDDVIIDTTNDLKPEKACKVLYHDLQGKRFVREAHEFLEKFNIEEGFNVLSKACWGMVEAIIDYELKKKQAVEPVPAPVEPPKSNIKQGEIENSNITWKYVDECNWEEKQDTKCSCEDHECKCEKEYIGEMIDPQVFETYHQQRENVWPDIPENIVKSEAYEQLDKLFTKRCNYFELVEKEYDNATNEYFLVGWKGDFIEEGTIPTQVCKIPKRTFEAILDTAKANDITKPLDTSALWQIDPSLWKKRKIDDATHKETRYPLSRVEVEKCCPVTLKKFFDLEITHFDIISRSYPDNIGKDEYFLVGVQIPGFVDKNIVQITAEAYDKLFAEYVALNPTETEDSIYCEDCSC